MTEPVVVGWGNNKWVVDSNTKALSLITGDGFSGSTFREMDNDMNNYTVPVGKKTTLLYYTVNSQGTDDDFIVTESINSNQIIRGDKGDNVNTAGPIPVYCPLEAGTSLTYSSTSGGSVCTIVAVECDV